MQIRTDQTVTGSTTWKDSSGNITPVPAGLTGAVSDPTKATIQVNADGTFKVTPLAPTSTPLDVKIISATCMALSTLTIVAGTPASGTITWGTPTPA